MDNSKQAELSQWVLEQTAYLDPPAGWQPDTDAALARLHDRMHATLWRPARSRWLTWGMAAAIPIAAFLLFSAGRGVAQLWQSMTVRQVAIIQVNPWPDGVPSPAVQALGVPIPPIPARDADEAR